MNPIIERLIEKGPALTDGAWGTEIQKMGLTSGEIPDAWNLEHPSRVGEVARAYVEAGSRIILTNTFRSNRVALAGQCLDGKVTELNRAGVEISLRAVQGHARVFGSIGPSGKLLMMGDVSEQDLRAAFTEQARALAAAGADALVVETMSDLREAVIAVSSAAETGLPVVASMVFDSGKNQDRTMTGVTPEQAAKELSSAGADVVGANCGQGIESFIVVCRRLKAATDRPIWIKPNAGLPELAGDGVVYNTTPEAFSDYAGPLVEAGASFLGGCCGTDPRFIRALSRELGLDA